MSKDTGFSDDLECARACANGDGDVLLGDARRPKLTARLPTPTHKPALIKARPNSGLSTLAVPDSRGASSERALPWREAKVTAKGSNDGMA